MSRTALTASDSIALPLVTVAGSSLDTSASVGRPMVTTTSMSSSCAFFEAVEVDPRAEIGELDHPVAVLGRLLERHLQPVLGLAAGPDEEWIPKRLMIRPPRMARLTSAHTRTRSGSQQSNFDPRARPVQERCSIAVAHAVTCSARRQKLCAALQQKPRQRLRDRGASVGEQQFRSHVVRYQGVHEPTSRDGPDDVDLVLARRCRIFSGIDASVSRSKPIVRVRSGWAISTPSRRGNARAGLRRRRRRSNPRAQLLLEVRSRSGKTEGCRRPPEPRRRAFCT